MELTLDHGCSRRCIWLGSPRGSHGAAALQLRATAAADDAPLPPVRRIPRARARSFDGCERVAILATGGISHDIATPRMGVVNGRSMKRGSMDGGRRPDAVVRYASEHVDEAGNGAEEIRMWMAAMASRPAALPASLLRGVNDWYTGIGIGHYVVQTAGECVRTTPFSSSAAALPACPRQSRCARRELP